eukprot:TRINITY_DN371_c0_g3_i1.p1 TRINITY_DN371_c0_g3~~TRINITY_DN371_c0_g3_i1.p1  ORF type:complete len:605 (-),score=62.06 TRINITY_DN371_c0_g3_i1:303-2117(-)
MASNSRVSSLSRSEETKAPSSIETLEEVASKYKNLTLIRNNGVYPYHPWFIWSLAAAGFFEKSGSPTPCVPEHIQSVFSYFCKPEIVQSINDMYKRCSTHELSVYYDVEDRRRNEEVYSGIISATLSAILQKWWRSKTFGEASLCYPTEREFYLWENCMFPFIVQHQQTLSKDDTADKATAMDISLLDANMESLVEIVGKSVPCSEEKIDAQLHASRYRFAERQRKAVSQRRLRMRTKLLLSVALEQGVCEAKPHNFKIIPYIWSPGKGPRGNDVSVQLPHFEGLAPMIMLIAMAVATTPDDEARAAASVPDSASRQVTGTFEFHKSDPGSSSSSSSDVQNYIIKSFRPDTERLPSLELVRKFISRRAMFLDQARFFDRARNRYLVYPKHKGCHTLNTIKSIRNFFKTLVRFHSGNRGWAPGKEMEYDTTHPMTIHGDVRRSNLLCDSHGNVRVIDLDEACPALPLLVYRYPRGLNTELKDTKRAPEICASKEATHTVRKCMSHDIFSALSIAKECNPRDRNDKPVITDTLFEELADIVQKRSDFPESSFLKKLVELEVRVIALLYDCRRKQELSCPEDHVAKTGSPEAKKKITRAKKRKFREM